MSTEQ